jgi:murein DD-endopeptidase MepM/ murein hydrolase activator NlpD
MDNQFQPPGYLSPSSTVSTVDPRTTYKSQFVKPATSAPVAASPTGASATTSTFKVPEAPFKLSNFENLNKVATAPAPTEEPKQELVPVPTAALKPMPTVSLASTPSSTSTNINSLLKSNPLNQASKTSTVPTVDLSKVYSKLGQIGAVTTPFGGKTRIEKFHPGIDLANTIGTPIPAFTGGTVVEAVTGKTQNMKGAYGNYVVVKDDQGNLHRYSHLSNEYVKVGDKVNKGQELGKMGNSGAAYSTSPTGTGSHLDYRIKSAANKYLNPNVFINSYFQGA